MANTAGLNSFTMLVLVDTRERLGWAAAGETSPAPRTRAFEVPLLAVDRAAAVPAATDQISPSNYPLTPSPQPDPMELTLAAFTGAGAAPGGGVAAGIPTIHRRSLLLLQEHQHHQREQQHRQEQIRRDGEMEALQQRQHQQEKR